MLRYATGTVANDSSCFWPYIFLIHSFTFWFQVRNTAAKILSGLIHSHFLSSEDQTRLVKKFRDTVRVKMTRSGKVKKFKKPDITKNKESLAKFHSGVLGLCCFVDAFPYDVPEIVPEILVELERHLHDPQPIPKTIKKTLQVNKININ